MINNDDCEKKNKFEDNYNFLIELGSGSFGSVWKVLDKKTKKEYAVKIEDKNNKSRLKNEYNIYKNLKKYGITFGIPKIKSYIESPKKCFLFMQLLGKSIDQIQSELPFDLASVLKAGIQITKLLEIVHNSGYIHRDIKPNNFLIGTGDDNDSIFIMDFGLSKRYLTGENNDKHIVMRVERSLVGTARYASINVHQGLEPSRRDDLESVGYMLVFLLLKKLPWQGLKKKEDGDHIKLIGDCKMKTSLNDLCYGVPPCFKEYIKYCRNLKFEEKPNYNYLKNLFNNYAKSKKIKLSYYWEKDNEYDG
jgi:casein kinase 1